MRQSRFGDGAKGAKPENALAPFAKQGVFCLFFYVCWIVKKTITINHVFIIIAS